MSPLTVVPAPTAGVDTRVALSTSLHAAPGVYAVLVGSGMSSAAGIPTGWRVVQDLIRKIALAEGVDPAEVEEHPEQWWASRGRLEPRYDTLMRVLGPTAAIRHALVRRYFDPSPEEGGPIRPTEGHMALARLVASGRIRVVVTTNFDRLIERALEEVGISPQVIATPADVRGMAPLAHARATVLKVNGDYARPGLRNTPEELESYPAALRRLLRQVFDEYGLLVVGWSADYDVALADAVAGARSRRYPTYWTTYGGHIRESAQRLVAQRGAAVIDTAGADEFLADIAERVDNLDRVAARQSRPFPMGMQRHRPELAKPTGWAAIPLLVLRAAATIGPAPSDDLGVLRKADRDRLTAALMSARLTYWLRELSVMPPASALVDHEPAGVTPLGSWDPTPDGYQTTSQATYRLGGDASSGISALVNFGVFGQGDSVLVIVDTGFSLAHFLSLWQAAQILRDALVLVTTTVPDSVREFLPPNAGVLEVEVHLATATNDGNQRSRPNDLGKRIDLEPLGPPTRPTGSSMGFAARISEPLSERAASDLVFEALEYMALDAGFLDPGSGLALVRDGLLPPNPLRKDGQ